MEGPPRTAVDQLKAESECVLTVHRSLLRLLPGLEQELTVVVSAHGFGAGLSLLASLASTGAHALAAAGPACEDRTRERVGRMVVQRPDVVWPRTQGGG